MKRERTLKTSETITRLSKLIQQNRRYNILSDMEKLHESLTFFIEIGITKVDELHPILETTIERIEEWKNKQTERDDTNTQISDYIKTNPQEEKHNSKLQDILNSINRMSDKKNNNSELQSKIQRIISDIKEYKKNMYTDMIKLLKSVKEQCEENKLGHITLNTKPAAHSTQQQHVAAPPTQAQAQAAQVAPATQAQAQAAQVVAPPTQAPAQHKQQPGEEIKDKEKQKKKL